MDSAPSFFSSTKILSGVLFSGFSYLVVVGAEGMPSGVCGGWGGGATGQAWNHFSVWTSPPPVAAPPLNGDQNFVFLVL